MQRVPPCQEGLLTTATLTLLEAPAFKACPELAEGPVAKLLHLRWGFRPGTLHSSVNGRGTFAARRHDDVRHESLFIIEYRDRLRHSIKPGRQQIPPLILRIEIQHVRLSVQLKIHFCPHPLTQTSQSPSQVPHSSCSCLRGSFRNPKLIIWVPHPYRPILAIGWEPKSPYDQGRSAPLSNHQ